jgi:hypothetical protein
MRRIFGSRGNELVGSSRKLHSEELHYWHSSPSIIIIIKSRRTRWAGNITRLGRRGMYIGFWWESQKEREPFFTLNSKAI